MTTGSTVDEGNFERCHVLPCLVLDACTDTDSKFSFCTPTIAKTQASYDSSITLLQCTLLAFIPPTIALLGSHMAEPFGSSDSVSQRLCGIRVGTLMCTVPARAV